jgi:hypothetical protein
VRLLRWVALLVIGLWVVAELVAIPVTNNVVEREVAAHNRGAATVHASAGPFPLLTRLAVTGRVNHVAVTLDRVAGQRLRFSEIRFDVRGADIDRGALLGGNFRMRSIDSGTVTATINLPDLGIAAPISSPARVVGRTLFVGRAGFTIDSDLIPCSPQASVSGDHIVLDCGFTSIPSIFVQLRGY